MKKTRILLLSALACSLAFSSCGFNTLQMPKKVKVRTDATYQFNVLNFDSEAEGSKFKVSDYFDLGKILEEKTSGDSSGSGINIYKYNNGSQYQQFLIHMPIKEIEFDFSESFKNMDFSQKMENIKIDKEFSIPSINQPEQTQPIDLSDVHKQLNKGVVFGGYTGDNIGISFVTVDGELDFTSITYSSGSLKVSGVNGSKLTGSVQLYDASSNEIASGSFDANGNATIDISNKSFTKTGMHISFSDTGKQFKAQIAEGSIIKVAEGVTLKGSFKPKVSTKPISFPFSLPDVLDTCEITDGSLEVKINRPGLWAAVIPEYSIALSGGLTANFTQAKATETYTDSNKATLSNGNIQAESSVTVSFDDATLDFEHSPSIYTKITINKISAEIKLEEGFTTDLNTTVPVTDLKEYIKEITWGDGKAGFEVTAKNNLPEGNIIKLKLGCEQLNIEEKEETINPGDTGETPLKFVCGTDSKTDFTAISDIVVTGSLTLPTGSGSNTLKISNVTPGQTYSVSLSVTPKFEWASAKVKMPDNAKFTNKMNTSINKKTLFSALGNDFADKIQISSLPLYIFATMPDGILGDGGFAGKIKSYYGDESGVAVAGSSEVSILDGSITTGKMPELIKNAAGEVTNNFGKETVNFAGALNSTADTGTLWLDYDIGLDGTEDDDIDITPEQIKSLQGKTSIKIDVALLMSMDFKIVGTINIDLMKLMNKQDSDLLGRTAATDTSAYEAYLSVVQSAAMEISNLKLPMNGDVALKMDLYKNGSGQTKEIGNGGSFALEVNPTELIKTYPLTPDIQIILGKQGTTSNFGLLKTMPVAGKISLKVKAKGDIPVFPFSEQN